MARKNQKDFEALVQRWHDAGKAAYHAGQARDSFPFPPALRRSGLDFVWQTGWDTGLFCDALTAGRCAQRDAANPYPDHPEAAAYWVQGWRMRHSLAALNSGENIPASRFSDASPGPFQNETVELP